MDTGEVDSYGGLGVNAPKSDRVRLRKVRILLERYCASRRDRSEIPGGFMAEGSFNDFLISHLRC